jgi:hypothetical protein
MRIIFLIAIIFAMNSCGDPDLTANCDNLLPASQAQFSDVYALFTASGDKSCDGCHSTAHPSRNYDLQSRPGVYDALTNHFDIVYAQIASGSMPPEDETTWSSSDLKTLSTWYCNGGFYDN